MARRALPYGAWPSPLSVELLAAASIQRRWLAADGTDLYWTETDPERDGRAYLRRLDTSTGAVAWVSDLAVRSRVHSYGGRPFTVRDGRIVAVGDDDQRLYAVARDAARAALTAEPPRPGSWRHGAPDLDRACERLAVLRERDGEGAGIDEIVLVDLVAGTERVVATGHDFFGAPAIRPDGQRVAVVAWDHPAMPWDESTLLLVDLAEDTVRAVMGGPGESVTQPRFGADGALYAISDRTGWWNLYRFDDPGWSPVLAAEAEFAPPPWLVGDVTYSPLDDGSTLLSWTSGGVDQVGIVRRDGSLSTLLGPWSYVDTVAASGALTAVLSSGPTARDDVVRVDVATLENPAVIVRSAPALADPYVSRPEALEVESARGVVYALYYPPTNPDVAATNDEAPPAVVHAHSGPTRRATLALSLDIQFWTTRGFAYLDVNYGGSTGFGRAYRERLRGQWGVVDVEDCAACLTACAERGLIDPDRVVSIGASASGVTTLGLVRRGLLAAAALRYPVVDLRGLAHASDKFESHYLEGLVGPLNGADAAYGERSALEHTDEITAPLALFHGADDPVVPLAHSRALARALDKNGVPYCLTVFADEGHGFRRPSTIRREAEIELAFFSRVLGITEADPLVDLEIHHAEGLTARR